MGQTVSSPEAPHLRTHEELSRELARRFADKCFSSLELYSLKDVFRGLADTEAGVRYLREDTIARFLEVPDILGASPVLFQMVSFLGAFPFLGDAPAVLGLEQMVIVVVIMTERYRRVLVGGAADRAKLFFKSLAVYDRRAAAETAGKKADKPGNGTAGGGKTAEVARSHAPGFAVDEVGDDDEEEGDDVDNDDLVLATFELLDMDKAVRHGDAAVEQGSMIPADNFRKLIMLLLLVAPLGAQESLSMYSARVAGAELASLRSTAESVLAAFLDVETSPGIKAGRFNRVLPVSFPHLFNGFNPLFEHFLFSKDLDLSKKDNNGAAAGRALAKSVVVPSIQPLLQDKGDIMSPSVLSQLSFFLPGSSLFHRLRLLYSGSEAGFSMGGFETRVFNWRAPTILLVRGTRLPAVPEGGREAAFAASLPQRRFPAGSGTDRLTFGVYVGEPWRHTHRECFGGPDTVLFQLEPVHDVFPASTLNRDYVTFSRPPGAAPAVAFGCPHPAATQAARRSSSGGGAGPRALGSVALLLDGSFEYAVFNHDFSHGGGAFRTSAARRRDFQDRFEVESLEVWGCGGDAEAAAQAERWAWEAREAEARRRINLGTGDIEADRALLEMAGLVGANRSGGSMG